MSTVQVGVSADRGTMRGLPRTFWSDTDAPIHPLDRAQHNTHKPFIRRALTTVLILVYLKIKRSLVHRLQPDCNLIFEIETQIQTGESTNTDNKEIDAGI